MYFTKHKEQLCIFILFFHDTQQVSQGNFFFTKMEDAHMSRTSHFQKCPDMQGAC
jgi:hypothetical protein